MLVVGILLVALAVAYLWRFYWIAREIKGPIPFPIVGNLLELRGNTEAIMKKYVNLFKIYGTHFRFWVGTKPIVAVADPEDIEIVLNSPNCLEKWEAQKYFQSFLGQGLGTITDISRWRLHRKLISPTFNSKVLQGFIPIFEGTAQILCVNLKTVAGKGNFDVFPLIANCTVDSICETAMGVKMNSQSANCDFVHWVDRLFVITLKRLFKPLYHFDFTFSLLKEKRELDTLVGKMTKFTDEVIKARKEQKQTASGKKRTFLDHLLEISETGNHFTDEEIRDEVQTFVAAGSDSSAGTISFALMMLGMHPEIQEKVIKEQEEIFGESNRTVTKEDLAQMEYLERVLKETLRLFPLLPIIERRASENIKLKNCTIPKGSGCCIAIYITHTDPKIWKEPFRFIPDRFLPEEAAKRHSYSWIPFSRGPRICIGMSYAMLAMKTMLSVLLRRYKICCDYEKVEDIRLKYDVALKPVEGHKISLEIRKS